MKMKAERARTKWQESVIQLDDIAYLFGYSPAVARRKAALFQLPVNAYRSTMTQKAPWVVNVEDFDDWRIKSASAARERMAA